MRINVRVIPNAKVRKVEKNSDGSLKVWVYGKPFHGQATTEVIEVLSDYFKTPKSLIKVIKGVTSRNKTIEIIE